MLPLVRRLGGMAVVCGRPLRPGIVIPLMRRFPRRVLTVVGSRANDAAGGSLAGKLSSTA